MGTLGIFQRDRSPGDWRRGRFQILERRAQSPPRLKITLRSIRNSRMFPGLARQRSDLFPAEKEGIDRPSTGSNHGQSSAEGCQNKGQPEVAPS